MIVQQFFFKSRNMGNRLSFVEQPKYHKHLTEIETEYIPEKDASSHV